MPVPKEQSPNTTHSTHAICPYLDEPPYYLWGVFGQRLHFAVENEWHQDVFLIGFQHDVAHCHGWSGYCLTRENEKHVIIDIYTREKATAYHVFRAYMSACDKFWRNFQIEFAITCMQFFLYLFIKIQCSFEVFEARVDHATIVVVT